MQKLAGTRPRAGHVTQRRTTRRVSPWQTTHARSSALRATSAPFSADSKCSPLMVRPGR
jgi:hypothetical protein